MLFVCIVERGSLHAAARQLEMPPATLTRRLQKLEATLGCRLLHRSARQLQPTSEGWQYYEQCQPMLAALQQTTRHLDAELHKPAGQITLLAPGALVNGVFGQVWPDFIQRYPDIRLQMHLSNTREDLLTQRADLALRVGEQPDSRLTQRLLGRASTVLVAAPDYLARQGWPQDPQALAQHRLLLSHPILSWRFQHIEHGERCVFQADAPINDIRLKVNDMQLAVNMAIAGVGILYCPYTVAGEALASGQLLNPLPAWRGASRPIYAVWPGQRALPARVRLLLDHLVDFADRQPELAAH